MKWQLFVFFVGLVNGLKPIYTPKNPSQEKYQSLLQNKLYSIIIAEGPAGTGKTALAVQQAVLSLKEPDMKKIILTRPVVSSDQGIGFLKGDLTQKMDPWVAPLVDVMKEFYPTSKIRQLMKEGFIEIAPFSFLRGRTFKHSFIIADESQNATPQQIKLLLTRIGEGSKMVLTGDLQQSDLTRQIDGLRDLMGRLAKQKIKGMATVRFHPSEALRHPLLPSLLDLYEDLP